MKRTIIILLCLIGIAVQAKVTLPDIISDNMVLQQQTEAKLWGWAQANTKITITSSWSDESISVRSDKQGYWMTTISTPKAGYEKQWINISDGEDLRLNNILIGEVWFCSGQSNMEMPLGGFRNCPVEKGNELIATSGEHPYIRVATIPRIGSTTPQEKVTGPWEESNSSNARQFSAVGYTFAVMLNRVLQVPVGLIVCAWGGSRVEGWLPREIVQTYPDIDLEHELAHPDGNGWGYLTPVVMYNGMLKPLQNYTIKGFLWYQGESNVTSYATYAARLQTMVQLWRKEWGLGELPFYTVEVAPYDYGRDGIIGARIREAQHQAVTLIPNSGIVSTNDLVYPYEPQQRHPRQKQEVGNRLAYMALNRTYQLKGIGCDYPTYQSMEIKGNQVELSFNHAEEGFSPWKDITGFEVAGADQVFHPAKCVLKGVRLVVESEQVKQPVAVRYCFRNFQMGNIHNIDLLPLVPFRTDNWE